MDNITKERAARMIWSSYNICNNKMVKLTNQTKPRPEPKPTRSQVYAVMNALSAKVR